MSIETSEYLEMLGRMIRAAGKRVAQADEPELRQLVELVRELESAIDYAISGMRENGSSWTQIGFALGVSRQAAQMKYGRNHENDQSRAFALGHNRKQNQHTRSLNHAKPLSREPF